MNNRFRKVLAAMLTLVMVVGGLTMIPNTIAKANDASVFSGSTESGNWANSISIDAEKFKGLKFDGTEIMEITYVTTDTTQWGSQIQMYSGETKVLECSNMDWTDSTKIHEITLSEDWKVIATNGLSIQGWNWTISEVKLCTKTSIYNERTVGDSLQLNAEKFEGLKFDGTEAMSITYVSTDTTQWGTAFQAYSGETCVLSWTNASITNSEKVFIITLSEDWKAVSENGVAIQGYNWTITDISVVKELVTDDAEDTDNSEDIDNSENTDNSEDIDNSESTDNSEDIDNSENTDNSEDIDNSETASPYEPDVTIPSTITVKTDIVNEKTSKDYTATIGYASEGWNFQDWETSTTVTGDGTYKITINAAYAASGATVFVIDIANAWAEMSGYQLMSLSITCDGVPVNVDLSKVLVGDLEDKGNYRIDIYNEYGDSKNDPCIDINDIAFEKNMVITFKLDSDGKENVAGTMNATINTANEYTSDEMSSLITKNATTPIAIRNSNDVFFIFGMGTMKLVNGITDYNFNTEFVTDYSSLTNAPFTADEFIVRVNYDYSGSLPAKASVMIPVGKELKGTVLYYYEINDDGTYTYVSKGTVDADGYLTVTQSHCSDYVITTYAKLAPKGDDLTPLVSGLLLLTGAAIITVGFYSKKRFA